MSTPSPCLRELTDTWVVSLHGNRTVVDRSWRDITTSYVSKLAKNGLGIAFVR